MTTYTLPWPVVHGLNPNHRVHWATKAKAKASLRAAWAWEATKQGARKLPAQKLHLLIEFVPPDKRARDLDNMLASIKAGLDGLSDVLGVDDKHWALTVCQRPAVGGFVRVTVEPRP